MKLITAIVRPERVPEVKAAFEKARSVRALSPEAREMADNYFFETVVRVHRASEGAPYTGLKPAGLDEGPVIPVAEEAIETGSPDALVDLLCATVQEEVIHKFMEMMNLKESANHSVDDAREYVEAMLGLQVWSHKLYGCAKTKLHEAHHQKV